MTLEAMRTAAVVMALLMLTPLAGAQQGFAADQLAVEGRSRAEGAASALFLLVGDADIQWEATAASVVIERAYTNRTTVTEPVNGIRYSNYWFPIEETKSFGAARLVSGDTRPEGALLVLDTRGDAQGVTTTDGRLLVRATQDPAFDQTYPPDVDVGNGDAATRYSIHEALAGYFLNLTGAAGDHELRGTLQIVLAGLDYTVLPEEGAPSHQQTGVYEVSARGPITESRAEIQRITLVDATIHVRTSGESHLFSQRPTVTFEGVATAEQGGAPLDASRFDAGAPFTLAPEDGRIAVASSGAPTLSPIPEAARLPAWLLVAAVLALGGATAAILVVRRRRREDDLALAILAMEERRYEDALPRLDRVVARRPRDALVLVDHAICLEEVGRLQEARASYEAALTHAPGNAEAHYYYARTLARLRMLGASAAHLAEALSLDPRLDELARREPAFRALEGGSLGVSR